jgi:DNA-binding transcriptional ArsR family regulator
VPSGNGRKIRNRLRLEGLVTPRREGKVIYYSLTDDRSKQIMEVVYDLFCADC